MVDATRLIGSRDTQTHREFDGITRFDVLRLIKDRILGDFADTR